MLAGSMCYLHPLCLKAHVAVCLHLHASHHHDFLENCTVTQSLDSNAISVELAALHEVSYVQQHYVCACKHTCQSAMERSRSLSTSAALRAGRFSTVVSCDVPHAGCRLLNLCIQLAYSFYVMFCWQKLAQTTLVRDSLSFAC